MGKFTQKVPGTQEFDGETVRYTLRRMTNQQLMSLAPSFGSEDANIVFRTARLVKEAREVLQACVSDVSGYRDSDGTAVTFETMLEEAYFLPLIDKMLGHLWRVSVVSEDEAKKSAAPPLAASSGETPGASSSAAS